MFEVPHNVYEFYAGAHMPRGVRNNNPGNIRHGDNWKGLCAIQEDPSFCQFATAEYGIRALAYLLRNAYYRARGLGTVRTIVNRWAPPTENDTSAYVCAVAKTMHVADDQILDLNNEQTLVNLTVAIIEHENGSQPYSDAQLLDGIRAL